MLIDQFGAQRYTVFAAFVNLYLSTGNTFYKECAAIFCSSPKPAASVRGDETQHHFSPIVSINSPRFINAGEFSKSQEESDVKKCQ